MKGRTSGIGSTTRVGSRCWKPQSPQRLVKRSCFVASAIVVALAVAACSGVEPTGTTEPIESATDSTQMAVERGELDGVWWKPRTPDVSLDIPVVFQIGPGDLFVLDGRAQLTSPVFSGSYTYVEDVVTYSGNQISDGPCESPGGPNQLAVTVLDEGKIATEVVAAEGCNGKVGTPGMMIRLSPRSEAGEGIAPPEGEYDDSFQFPSQLNGIWLRQGTGEILYVHSADSTYARTTTGDLVEAPLDSGTFEFIASGADQETTTLMFTSDGSGDCSPGETMTWTAVQWNRVPPAMDPPLGPIGAVKTDAADSCGISSGSQTWIHVAGA